MTYAWNEFSLSLALKNGPQEVPIRGKRYLCYTYTPNRRFFATCPTDITVYELHLDGQQVTQLALDIAQPIAMSVWQVTAGDLYARAAQVGDLTEANARTAIASHFSTGLATPGTLSEELLQLIMEYLPEKTELVQQLARYNNDMPGSSRRLTACAAALVLLAMQVKT